MTARRAASFFLFFAALLAAAPANASLKLCNRTSYILYAAVAATAKTDVVTQGWTRIAPGACETAIPTPLRSPPYYLYARSSRSHSGPSRAWGGTAMLCVGHNNFTFTTPAGARCTEGDGFAAGFSRLDTGRKSDFTETLTGKPEITTLSLARMAGIQRLLSDNGYKIPKIDGNDDKQTEAALANFRRKARLARKYTDDQLFTALEDAAAKVASPAGYSICNATAAPFWAAIGLKQGQSWVSRGWWKVPPANCATAISEPLNTDRVYLLADVPGKKPVATGKTSFCVTAIAFEIQGKDRCKERGMRQAGFAETNVKGRPGYVARIGPQGLMSQRRNN